MTPTKRRMRTVNPMRELTESVSSANWETETAQAGPGLRYTALYTRSNCKASSEVRLYNSVGAR